MNFIAFTLLVIIFIFIIVIYINFYKSEKQIEKRKQLDQIKLNKFKLRRICISSILILISPIMFNFIKFNIPFIEAIHNPSNDVYQMYINVDIDINDFNREDYINGKVVVKQEDEIIHNNLSMKMRGRGNTTWTKMPKKSYRIKFDKRESILGMKSARDYVILAEHADKTLLRTYGAHKLSSYLNIGYSIETRFLEVYINGEYNGFYLLAEQVEIDKNRLNLNTGVNEQDGYLVEYEALDRLPQDSIEDYHYFKVGGQCFILKDIDYDDYTEEQIRYKISLVKKEIEQLEQSFIDGTYNKYINIDSFIDYFLLQEIYKELDVYRLSIYFYKDNDGLIYMGPCWDFDLSTGVCQSISSPEGIYAEKNKWFSLLMNDSNFRDEYIKRFNFVYEYILHDYYQHMRDIQKSTLSCRERNFYKWRVMFWRVWPNSIEATISVSVNLQDDYYNWFMEKRVSWLYKYYNK